MFEECRETSTRRSKRSNWIQVPGTMNDTSSSKTPENKRPLPDLSPLADTAVIEQLRILQDDKLKLMDYEESLLISHQSKTKQRFSLSSYNSIES